MNKMVMFYRTTVRFGVALCIGLLLCLTSRGNRVKVDSVEWKITAMQGTKLPVTVKLSWENSWRDWQNHDAVYLFFKFKKREDVKADDKTAKENWNHLFIQDDGVRLLGTAADEFDYWLCPLSVTGNHLNGGVYVFRKGMGHWGKNELRLEFTWDFARQMVLKQLTTKDIEDGKVMISAHAIEMVYVPRGPFRLGDGVANKGFANVAFPLPAEYDIIGSDFTYQASAGNPRLAADRMNDNASTTNSCWIGTSTDCRWWVDFGEGIRKRITYFGVNASLAHSNYIPTFFRLEGSQDPTSTNPDWKVLWRGEGNENWSFSKDSYPIARAIAIDTNGVNFDSYRSYRLVVEGMRAGVPEVKSIGMSTERDLEAVLNHTVLIDGPTTIKDSINGLWARDGATWAQGTIAETFPNGYRGFYAMKYEISQEQYVGFLNQLNYLQQNSILDGRLDAMQEGEYIFGERACPNARNGIMLATKVTGMPAVFACNLEMADGADGDADGQNIACNFMNIRDMLSYADWACLRPLSEIEYEKMCRHLYPEMPVKAEYAWHTSQLIAISGVDNPGMETETVQTGNANYDGYYTGPVRTGAFSGQQKGRIHSGASFWGIFELSGNLAEMYYNVNHLGLTVLKTETGSGLTAAGHDISHGDGSIDIQTGAYNGAKNKRWLENPEAIAVRGGSYRSRARELQVSDRTWCMDYFTDVMTRDSLVSFRLGRSVPDGEPLTSILILENEQTTESGNVTDVLVEPTYWLEGNIPAGADERECIYLWYTSENGGSWKIMDGECNRNLYFDKYTYSERDSVSGYDHRFKRRVVTPYSDSGASTDKQAIIQGTFAPAMLKTVKQEDKKGN